MIERAPPQNYRILYGMMAEGNGHISRGRIMVPALEALGAKVDVVLSGRPAAQLKEMEEFGHYRVVTGLSFAKKDGQVDRLASMFNACANSGKILREIAALDVGDYEAIITDYEPTVAWSAALKGKKVIGLGHQYAFGRSVPGTKSLRMMPLMAPATTSLGAHWHHFNQAGILPPLVDVAPAQEAIPNKILVYMPIENPQAQQALFSKFPAYDFHVYSPRVDARQRTGNVIIQPPSKTGFKADFADCAGVITNAGFETPSEALALGKKILVKPMTAQPEQEANAKALAQLGLGAVMHKLDAGAVANWLAQERAIRVSYPDVGAAVARWIVKGDHSQKSADALARSLWAQTDFHEHAPSY